METAKMSERGQIIIPKEIRSEVGALENTIFALSSIDKDTIIMKKLNTNALVNEFRRFRNKSKKLSPFRIEEEVNAARKSRS